MTIRTGRNRRKSQAPSAIKLDNIQYAYYEHQINTRVYLWTFLPLCFPCCPYLSWLPDSPPLCGLSISLYLEENGTFDIKTWLTHRLAASLAQPSFRLSQSPLASHACGTQFARPKAADAGDAVACTLRPLLSPVAPLARPLLLP